MSDSSLPPSTTRLIIDPVTAEDLCLFALPGTPTDSAGETDTSLYSYCNKCKTQGGEAALKRRMRAPSSSAVEIRDTQLAILFINEHFDAFAELPAAYVVGNADEYTRDSLPIISDQNPLAFASQAFSLWANEDRFYIRITKGVGLCARVIRSMRRFLQQLEYPQKVQNLGELSPLLGELSPLLGELSPLLDELHQLLQQPRILAITEQDGDRWFWQTLRLDQVFRLHESESIRRLIEIIYDLDALASLAKATREHNLVMPEIAPDEVAISAHELVHPFVSEATANPVDLNQAQSLLFLTGPNMAGKTTYLRAVATALYLAHLGMGVPAKSFRFAPVQRLITTISMSDDLNDGVSYFRAEALRIKAVAQAVAEGYKVVAIMDEPFKGTNVKDAFDASQAVLRRLSEKHDCLFMVSSHLIELGSELEQSNRVSFKYFEAEETGERLHFDYVLHTGVSAQRLGMRVLREEGIFQLLDNPP